MSSMRKEEIRAIGKAAGLRIDEPELTSVHHNLNAILQTMRDIDIPSLNSQEPLPIITPKERRDG